MSATPLGSPSREASLPNNRHVSRRGKVIFWLGLLLIAGVVVWLLWKGQEAEAKGPPGMGGGPPGMMGARAVAVTAAQSTTEDFGEWITVSGTITPLHTVMVRSRVDGELQRVAFEEGQDVEKGALLAEIDSRSFEVQRDQAQGALARDLALLENARTDLARYEALWKQDSISRQEVDTQKSLVSQYEAAIESDRATVANAELQLSYTKVLSPLTGRVGLRQVDPGNLIRAGDTAGLVVVTQMDPIGLLFSIPQDRVPAILRRLAEGAKLPVDAWDKEQQMKLGEGVLVTTDNQIDLASGTLRLKAELPNQNKALFPNQFVMVRLLVDTRKEAVVAPANAVRRGATGEYVYILADGKASLRAVRTGATQGEKTLILEGLQAGETVATQGLDRLREGASVEIITGESPKGTAPPTL